MFAVGMTAIATAGPAHAATPKVGEVAPDFTLTLIDGSKVSLADLKGQVIVLNFWATWCGPCRTELPLLDSYYAAQKRFGLQVFAVEDQGEASVPMYRLKPFLSKLTMPSARRIKGPFAALGGLPTNYVIDRKGVVRYAKAGAFDLDDLNELLVPLLKEPAPAGTVTAGL
ncbi:MAG TPA: TlpA disulfide reductase family protein [Sphingobium sp.]